MRRDAQEHREQLIQAASRVFARQGTSAPLEAVLEEAKLGRGTLYRHFPNRSALAIAVLEIPLARLRNFVDQHLEDSTLLPGFLSLHRELAVVYQGSGMLATDPESKKEFKEFVRRADCVYEVVLQRSVAAGTLQTTATVELIRLATKMIMGAGDRSEEGKVEETVQSAIQLVCAGLRFG